jgi:hypothetical protein
MHFLEIFRRGRSNVLLMLMLVVSMFVLTVAPAAAQAEIELDINVDSFITSINSFLPLAIQIVGFAAGIAIAFAIAMFVANALLRAFKGQSI